VVNTGEEKGTYDVMRRVSNVVGLFGTGGCRNARIVHLVGCSVPSARHETLRPCISEKHGCLKRCVLIRRRMRGREMQHALGILGLPNGDNISPSTFEILFASTALVKPFRENAEVSTSWLACLVRFSESANLEVVETVDRNWLGRTAPRCGDARSREHVVDSVSPDIGFVALGLGCGVAR